jgi:hypothetical protein
VRTALRASGWPQTSHLAIYGIITSDAPADFSVFTPGLYQRYDFPHKQQQKRPTENRLGRRT